MVQHGKFGIDDVRFGSKADIAERPHNVRFTDIALHVRYVPNCDID